MSADSPSNQDLRACPLATKGELRQWFQAQRQQQNMAQISQRICDHLARHSRLVKPDIICLYMPVRAEVNLLSLLSCLPEKTWALPRCRPGRTMSWHVVSAGDIARLQPHSGHGWEYNRFGIPEPAAHLPQVKVTQIDLVLVPALACDRWGARLGYGGGFYDRFLSVYQGVTMAAVPGVCWSTTPLPRDPWDKDVHTVVTEEGVQGVRQ
ncbi:MAG: 5-formyltetrahydrofolate cyclo-ligase [Synechococcaceae cyanobacterium SM2_3_1]|nr:5-formyltetrahydrofolate cyclo-ligase [Synechococcaceae cyanobacterium SM2_3_1]